MSIEKDEDEDRRMREISIFAAMASGESFHKESETSTDYQNMNESSLPTNQSQITLDMEKSQDHGASPFLSKINEGIEDSGTFAIMSDHTMNSSSSNLHAALSSITGQVENSSSQPQHPSFPSMTGARRFKSTQMHSERVLIPRTLFFGPILPPRVVRETRDIVRDNLLLVKGKELPPHVSNLISAIQVFGYGISPYPSEDDDLDEHNPAFYTGSPYLSTIQPVWGNPERSERFSNLKKKVKKRNYETLNHFQNQAENKNEASPSTRDDTFLKWMRETTDISASQKDTTSENIRTVRSSPILSGESQIIMNPSTKREYPYSSQMPFDVPSPLNPSKTLSAVASPLHDQNLFAKLARGEKENFLTTRVSLKKSRSAPSSSSDNFFVKWIRGEEDDDTSSVISEIPEDNLSLVDAPSEEKALFSQWALEGDTLKPDGSIMLSTEKSFRDTIRNVSKANAEDSDEDSVVGSELKQKVGINEHLDAALASLTGDQSQVEANASESLTEEQAQAIMQQLGQVTAGGRPLSNLELTGGCVPIFASDDSALPSESDLGIYETRDEQQYCLEKRREQEVIEKYTMPDIFGTISCPNPATGPDDNHSFNVRAVAEGKTTAMSILEGSPIVSPLIFSPDSVLVGRGNAGAVNVMTAKFSSSPEFPSLSAPKIPMDLGRPPRQGAKKQKRFNSAASNSRYGWWNILDDNEEDSHAPDEAPDEAPCLKPGTNFVDIPFQVKTGLEPKPKKIREENMPLSRLHPATTVASSMPFLSDRPPNWRYLQVDTMSIDFAPLGGEIEPFFCSVAIYHVETLPRGSRESGSVPTPNFQKCGRVTEVLHFDVVSDPDVEKRCFGALWPFHDSPSSDIPETERTQGTRCGVFPIPSNLNIANLFVIIVVHKVLSPIEDLEIYTKQIDSADSHKLSAAEREKYRERAEKASNRQGQFLMPFAFGVTPLLQALSTETPMMVISKAATVPLSQFQPGLSIGERQIIDRVMFMLYPRANKDPVGNGGATTNTNGGTALLVMRYFGYLGLHSVVNSKSSLSRHRLVDFTGELQVRICDEDESIEEDVIYKNPSDRDYVVKVPNANVTTEPTALLGRNIVPMYYKIGMVEEVSNAVNPREKQSMSSKLKRSHLYAQELAAVPLQISPYSGSSVVNSPKSNRGRYDLQHSDSDPGFHTSFCNELLCNPRLVHNCPKGNIVTKVELREVEWNEELNSYIARSSRDGPRIHNQRRGPPFVSEAFTPCSFSSTSVSFLSEFKVKLPLLLCDPQNPLIQLVLLFSVYHVDIKRKKSWAERGKTLTKQFGVNFSESSKSPVLHLLGCGFLPLTYSSDVTCLIDTGLHDVKLCFDAKSTSGSQDELILTKKPEPFQPLRKMRGRDKSSEASMGDDDSVGGSVEERNIGENDVETESNTQGRESRRLRAPSTCYSDATNDQILKAATGAMDQMSLQVRIVVHSSIHPQNATLTEFLQSRRYYKDHLSFPKLPRNSPWRLSRENILNYIKNGSARSVALHQSSSKTQQIISSTMNICKNTLCSSASLSQHCIRATFQLLVFVVTGTGEPSLIWANPASTPALRTQAFASLLQCIHLTTSFLSKSGYYQLDGKSNWNVTSLATIISSIFEEEDLFSSQGIVEPIDEATWCIKPVVGEENLMKIISQKSSTSQRKRHSRSDSDSLIFSSDTFTGGIFSFDKTKSQTDSIMPLKDNSTLRASKPDGETSNETLTKIFSQSSVLSSEFIAQGASSLFQEPNAYKNTKGDSVQRLPNVAFAGTGSTLGRRKYMTLPSNALATIREDNDASLFDKNIENASVFPRDRDAITSAINSSSKLDSELVIKESRDPVKQMRVPKTSKGNKVKSDAPVPLVGNYLDEEIPKKVSATDEDIELAGFAFLEMLGENLGYKPKGTAGEEKHVGHHRKTASKCSIDWTLPTEDFLPLGIESLHVTTPGNRPTPFDFVQETDDLSLEMTTLNCELNGAKKFPSFIERIDTLSRSNQEKGRWFPYLYEVLIFQWVSALTQHRRQGSNINSFPLGIGIPNEYYTGKEAGIYSLRESATCTRDNTVSCAPVILELIKKSLGTRLHHLLRQSDATRFPVIDYPPLIILDSVITEHLEKLIEMLTDLTIESKNFDSKECQQRSIDVNDSIVRFLRDMFALLHPESVHRLVLIYFSRFLKKEGKHWQDRDSKIGLRCSWEICKLRLNAVTAFVRCPDFVKVNCPQISLSMAPPGSKTRAFYDSTIETFFKLGMSSFTSTDSCSLEHGANLPKLKPHWLAEIVVDICLSGTEHAEQKIQHRSSSLLHELFWSNSIEGKVESCSSGITSMYMTFLLKILSHNSYLSSLHPKSQLRKDLLPCVLFILQSAPIGMLQALWRKLCRRAQGKVTSELYGPVPIVLKTIADSMEVNHEPHIFDVFSMLNLALSTFEYGGAEDGIDNEDRNDDEDQVAVWAKEFMPSINQKIDDPALRRGPMFRRYRQEEKDEDDEPVYSSTSSRKWNSHDGSLVVINTCRCIVRELLALHKTEKSNFETSPKKKPSTSEVRAPHIFVIQDTPNHFSFTEPDIIVFVRAAGSVYLHALAIRESDTVTTKALTASIELLKIFGIKLFFEAVRETLQHWMRVVLIHCGSRRATVRIQALEFLALILRVTWDSFGNFFRIRQPLLAVQTEVMERIVAIATTKFYREQRRIKAPIQYLSNDSAEACLSMFWRTLDRLHYQSASQNLAFRSAIVMLAKKMKKLYRAYIAAHALSILRRARMPSSLALNHTPDQEKNSYINLWSNSRRISVHRVITASAGYCKQFLGFGHSSTSNEIMAHHEALEDAFLDAADVFSATELPSHRVAWLQKLAEFHADRQKFAEEATCHFQIQMTFRQAAHRHEMIWSSAPFLPWTDSVHIDGEGPAGEPDYDTDDLEDCSEDRGVNDYGRQIEKSNGFRRIFYRVANSVRMRTGDWEINGNKHLFYGVTLASEYGNSSPWMTLRELEGRMIEEAETSGELYLNAGILESSRAAWVLATNYYAVRCDYPKLARAYRRLSLVVASQVPIVDTNEQALDFSHPIGRFYRVWYHGGAPDELLGAEFVYRAPSSMKLQEFGANLSQSISSILPENAPIDLVLDDGKPDQAGNWRSLQQRRALGPVSMEPVKIKVTPLRPMLKNAQEIRGTPEWFLRYIEYSFPSQNSSTLENQLVKNSHIEGLRQYRSRQRDGDHSRSFSASIFGSHGSHTRLTDENPRSNDNIRQNSGSLFDGTNLVSADKFTFMQPIKRDRNRITRDWLKSSGDFAEKSLRVTLLQVDSSFPACVTRQRVIQRSVFTQSPLEAGLDAICSWCAILFRTAVATNGMQVLGRPTEHGIGNAAAKVVADCIHSSRIKEMGQTLLKKHGSVSEEGDGQEYVKLNEIEVRVLQSKFAKGLVIFIELLHLLIARNRDQLLTVVESRKATPAGNSNSVQQRQTSASDYSPVRSGLNPMIPLLNQAYPRGIVTPGGVAPTPSKVYVTSATSFQDIPRPEPASRNRSNSGLSVQSAVANEKTDLAIAVQSELQRAFISLCKALYQSIATVLEAETPRWLKQCCLDNYFSMYTYRQTKIPMADEVCFLAGDDFEPDIDNESLQMSGSYVSSADPGLAGYNNGESETGSAL